jgi:hypothetical protein
MLQNYLACGEDSSEAMDFYSLNAYEWFVALLNISCTRIITNTKQVRRSNVRHVRIRLPSDERLGLQYPNLFLRDRLHC